LVEQGIENPRVGGSIPSPATIVLKSLLRKKRAFFIGRWKSVATRLKTKWLGILIPRFF
jgi:hypothetical protein